MPLGPTRGGSAGILPYHSMPVFLHFGNSTNSGGLGGECLQPSLEVSGKLCVSFNCISSSSSVQVSGRTCQRSTQTIDSGGTMLDGGSLASQSSQHVGRCSLALSHHKLSIVDVLKGQVPKGLPYLHLTLGCSEMCVAQAGVLFLSLSGSGKGNLRIFIKGLPAVSEGMGKLTFLRGCTKQCHICP